jgi:hypothetical protein
VTGKNGKILLDRPQRAVVPVEEEEEEEEEEEGEEEEEEEEEEEVGNELIRICLLDEV